MTFMPLSASYAETLPFESAGDVAEEEEVFRFGDGDDPAAAPGWDFDFYSCPYPSPPPEKPLCAEAGAVCNGCTTGWATGEGASTFSGGPISFSPVRKLSGKSIFQMFHSPFTVPRWLAK